MHTSSRRLTSLIVSLGLAVAIGCGGDDTPLEAGAGGNAGTGGSGGTGGIGGNASAQCAALGELCHDVDDGDGRLAECHDLGHAEEPEACVENFADCITLCLDAAHENTAGAGGGHGEGSDLCAFIGTFCHDVDDEDGPLHECHELGHAGDAEACSEHAAECVVMCAEAGAGPGHGGQHSE